MLQLPLGSGDLILILNLKLKGIKLNISKWRRPAPNTIPWDTKAAGLYMICTLSKHEAEAKDLQTL